MRIFEREKILVEKDYKKGAIIEALKNYPNRNYRLIKAIKKEKEYNQKPHRRDKKIRQNFEKNYKTNINKKYIVPGQLIMFNYLLPKYKDELEYYDAMPMTIFFGVKQCPEGLRVIGFNLHYYPPKIRYTLMDTIFEIHKNAYLQSWDKPLTKEMPGFDYNMFIHRLRDAKLDFGIRMYDPELMREIRPLPPKAWSKAVFTEGKFMKRSRSAILNYWANKKIQTESNRKKLQRADENLKKHIKTTKNKYG